MAPHEKHRSVGMKCRICGTAIRENDRVRSPNGSWYEHDGEQSCVVALASHVKELHEEITSLRMRLHKDMPDIQDVVEQALIEMLPRHVTRGSLRRIRPTSHSDRYGPQGFSSSST
jgi:hypothetical protein